MSTVLKDVSVLLVVGRTEDAEATREALTELGCDRVVLASNSREAARLIASTLPRLFIVDAGAHYSDNTIAAVERLRLRYRVPVLYIIDRDDAVSVRRIHRIEDATTLARPYEATSLALAIAQAMKLAPEPT
jgi:AmiR/NasT family two-component response regulator